MSATVRLDKRRIQVWQRSVRGGNTTERVTYFDGIWNENMTFTNGSQMPVFESLSESDLIDRLRAWGYVELTIPRPT